MEMKDIDLTQCINCRFRAKDDGKEVEGRIAVDGDYLRFFYNNGDMYSIHIPCYQEHGINYFDDLEIVPRDPETYKDWQVGDTIEYSDNYSTGRIIFRGGDFVAADIEGTCNCYTCDELFNEGYRLVLTDIEKKIIDEKKVVEDIPKPYVFRKGEPVLVRDDNESIWILGSFIQFIPTSCFHVTSPSHWKQCIPYNKRTMRLLGTAEDYKEEL